MRQLIQLLSGTKSLTVILDGEYSKPEKPYAYRFNTPRGDVLVAWCQVPAEFKLPIEPDTETVVTDMLGNTIAKVTDSYFTAQLSETPIFLH